MIAEIISGSSLAYSLFSGYKSNEAQRSAQRAQRQIEALKAASARRSAYRAAQEAAASAVGASAATGTYGSSRTQQAIGSASGQLGSFLSESDTVQALGDSVSSSLAKASRYQYYGNVVNQLASAYPME